MNLPTGTITFLFTDIEGSTRLWEEHPEAMRSVLARHDTLLRQAIQSNNGHVFKTVGDAFCAAFSTASEALSAALQSHLLLIEEEWGEIGSLRVRIALHTGVAHERDGDYFGPTLNRVARLQSTGSGGQTLLSHTTYSLVCHSLPTDVTLQDMGRHRLKDLLAPEQVWQLLHPALPSQFPPLKSLDYLPTNLPRQITSFIGREKEIAEVESVLKSAALVTLTGTGGTGKTRLALQVGAGVLEEYEDGVWLVELAAIADPALTPQSIATALQLREEAGRTLLQTVESHLRNRQLLLILDNCEHLVSACARVCETLLKNCPHLTILATSREPLGVNGERSWRTPSLLTPDPDALPHEDKDLTDLVMRYDAPRLFVERAVLHRQDFVLRDGDAPVVARLCQQLGGIPLAIELAAARVRSLSVEEINARLDNRFRLLTGGSRTALPRHQTLRAMIDWSYDLLNGQEKILLHRLSVFAGGWTLEAAEKVCSDFGFWISDFGLSGAPPEGATSSSETDRQNGHYVRQPTSKETSAFQNPKSETRNEEVLDLHTSLVDKSLVVAEVHDERTRYRLLETVRQYARDRLVESRESDEVQRRHRDYFLAYAEEAETQLTGADQAEWLKRLEAEHENLRAGLDWSLSEVGSGAGLRLCGALCRFWWTRARLSEGREWCQRNLDRPGAEEWKQERARALNGVGTLAHSLGDYAPSRAYHEESLAIKQEIGDRAGIASSLNNLGRVVLDQGDYAASRAYHEASLAIYKEIGDRVSIATLLMNLGGVAADQGDYAAARAYDSEGLLLSREVGDRRVTASLLHNLGIVASDQGDYASAWDYHQQSLAIQKELGFRVGIAASLNCLGTATQYQGHYASARAYFDEALAINREIGNQSGIAQSLHNLGTMASDQGDYASARAYFRESLAIRAELGSRVRIAFCLEAFAFLAAKENRLEQAVVLWAVAAVLREEVSSPVPPSERAQYDRDVADVRQALGEEAFTAAQAQGRAMPLERAIEYALDRSPS